ncbi:MAG: hypothetical protein NTY03_16725 [Candidatus Bathyarchaeota archaeon]|nr:hypothetical protein [Candidatus Bathyarchaeota archaeon]
MASHPQRLLIADFYPSFLFCTMSELVDYYRQRIKEYEDVYYLTALPR